MPLRNRATPFGTLIAAPERGAWMGNRGCLHDQARRLTGRRWKTRAWIVCRLDFKGRRREVMAPGRYTELFFLDEATAFAAGHRPCAECRRADYLRFREAWAAATGLDAAGLRAAGIDAGLHAARLTPPAERPEVDAVSLPDGAFVIRAGDPETAWLVAGGALRRWRPGGYGPAERPTAGERLRLLTPPGTVAAMTAGYVPQIDASAGLR